MTMQENTPESTPEVQNQSSDGGGGKRSGLITGLLAIGVLLFKFVKPLLVGIKFLKFGALFKTGATMIVCMWAYANLWGWQFAVAFVLLIFFHEMGHVYALKQYGIRSTVPFFIPFVGAFVALKEMPKNAEIEAWVGIAGPLVGTGAATLCWSYGLYTGQRFWFAVAYSGFFINLLNLLPVRPLDGGRTVAAISPKLWILGVIGLVLLLFRSFNPILLVILFFGLQSLYQLWKKRHEDSNVYYAVPLKAKIQLSCCYFGLLLFLAYGMSQTQVHV
ncbi:site-2 protease family protein [Desulfogranum japonicum]|uniref:site-2 protease family protein n=1 Tax=Desulfogranum japonicum TaxID=231447 RepID=UPI00041CC862|nr:site-2 protease family protein [Desulfogranum japonicum]